MPKLLCIETTSTNCSVALADQNGCVLCIEDQGKHFSHAEKLHLSIAQLLQNTGLKVNELDGVSVSMGPGSYTGLRIGVSTAKGLCYALNIPLLATATLFTLARQIVCPKGLVIPMVDARRMEVYAATFSRSYELLDAPQAKILSNLSYQSVLDSGVIHFIGSGVEKFKSICKHANADFYPNRLPSAKEMAAISIQRWYQKKFENLTYFEPYYLKDFVSNPRS